ncbi:MAG: glutamate racemase [Clostridia bacterium]
MSKIGVFDSGIGGLTLVKALLAAYPHEEIIYYGDTARVPYGSKNTKELIFLADKITGYLVEQGAELIVDACNTTSAVALPHLKDNYDLPIFGVIEPGVAKALVSTKNGKIGLLATEVTVKTEAHKKLLERNKGIVCYAEAAPALVPLIEAGKINDSATKKAVAQAMAPLMQAGIDTLILGCTHYPFISHCFSEIGQGKITLINPAEETVRTMSSLLEPQTLQAGSFNPASVYFTSKDVKAFAALAKYLLPEMNFPQFREYDILVKENYEQNRLCNPQ